ncbi:uncharacterized protein RHO25_009113 [Cercospora beticola]|uniref:Uncharacterized protein n=1 Tax=Cercospora beticola TaxID=122368 RepID=A0ABZ0NXY0_CERBT|nr:hypothetical protein RHO25_009113 [Cercospora beticola]CAK1356699.1 unnamed protein product [Cercospora beticola]
MGSQYPAENDVFWVDPVERLPDPDGKLRNYNQERAKVFDTADKNRDTQTDKKDNVGQKSSHRLALEASWSKLKDALKKG